MPIIQTNNLFFSYPKRKVLDGIDFALYQGEVVSLLGPNGCGKSTLIRLILGLLKPKSGMIMLHNQPLNRLSHRDIAQHIAYIPQYHAVPFGYSVEEMVMMGRVWKLGFFASPSKQDRDIAHEALERIGIEMLATRPFGELSGGQKQMVLIARALAQEARTFIMDEPVTGLDYGNQIRLLELIVQLSTQGYTFLKTTHYPDHALLVSSRIVVMNNGKIVANGTSSEVINTTMIETLYGIKAEIVTYRNHPRCIPLFTKGTK